MNDLKNKSKEYWKKKLTPEQYHVLREKGTEAAGTGKFYQNFETGMYACVACGNELFPSDTKFDSDCGWPSFDKSLEGAVDFHDDYAFGMHRIEVTCNKCGGHLGHILMMAQQRPEKDIVLIQPLSTLPQKSKQVSTLQIHLSALSVSEDLPT